MRFIYRLIHRRLLGILPVLMATGLLLTGCATPIPAEQMLANSNIYPQLSGSPALSHAVSIGHVSLSSSLPTTGVVVTQEEFSKALEISLGRAGWLAPQGGAKYQLSANFIDFDQPFTLFNTKMFSEVAYTVNAVPSGNVVYQQTVKIPCVLGITDVFNADARRIETMKCSIRENVTHMMRDINSKF